MSSPIITVEHLSKRYYLGQIGATTLRESAQHLWHRLRGQNPDHALGKASAPSSFDSSFKLPLPLLPPDSGFKSQTQTSSTDFWALKDVSFEVQPGEVLGIIGRNGAGKSTLLKILSRITEPTSGRAILRGRVASLLEVGTGFHPELTGRDNIFLNGAILGMKNAEIARKFDEIVAFAEVERFIDTPVKRYSSGMYVRLAFAVAAHLEPEILIVDEVLAVGDIEFQKKCLGKMTEVARQGRTILFVSHNITAMQHLCSVGVLLAQGVVSERGDISHVISKYLEQKKPSGDGDLTQRPGREGDGRMRFRRITVLSGADRRAGTIRCGDYVEFVCTLDVWRAVRRPVFYLGICDQFRVQLLHMNTYMRPVACSDDSFKGTIVCAISKFPLPPGKYIVNVAVAEEGGPKIDRVECAAELDVAEGNFFKTGASVSQSSGLVLVDHEWRFAP